MVLEEELIPLGKNIARERFRTRVVPLIVLAASAFAWVAWYRAEMRDMHISSYEVSAPCDAFYHSGYLMK